MGGHPFLDHPGPLAIAHRGGAIDAPENSMEAFAAAVELGYRYVETDVHATADGVLVAFHDPVLDRVTDHRGRIADLTWAEVRTARIHGTGTIPRFEDLLDAWPQLRINVDPKADRAVTPLVDVLERGDALHRVCLGSFSDRRIAEARDRLGEGLCTSLGPRQTVAMKAASIGVPMRRPRGDCLQIPVQFKGVQLVTERLLATAHAWGMAVHVWTIDDPIEMHRLLDLGVHGVMTDRPVVLREVLEARDSWHP